MTQAAARNTSASTSDVERLSQAERSGQLIERARRVEEAVHSLRMEGLDLAPEDAADAAEYVAGRISVDEYGRRTRARYGVPEGTVRASGAQGLDAADVAATRPTAARSAQRGR